jgi:hypothetical protein
VLDGIVATVTTQLAAKGPEKFILPGIARFTLSKRQAVKGGVKKINPFNVQEYVTKDKPASNRVNIRPVKAMKDVRK